MRILFIHPNFPGQFRHLARRLVELGHEVRGLGRAERRISPVLGVSAFDYVHRREPRKEIHHYLRHTEGNILDGQVVLEKCIEFKQEGFTPDVIFVHIGWGGGLYLREIFRKSTIVAYCEFYYRASQADVGFDPEFPRTLDNNLEVDTKNLTTLLSLVNADVGWSPTRWQASLFPDEFLQKIRVIHDGIAVNEFSGPAPSVIRTVDGRLIRQGDKVLTFVSRTLEPHRGFHVFMRTLPEIQRRNPDAITVIIGAERGYAYGNPPREGGTWYQKYMKELEGKIDLSKIVFTGELEQASYRALLKISRAHVYMTYPFVLSWSMLEAMASACLVIGSNTPPVADVIKDGMNGLVFDFFDQQLLAEKVTEGLRHENSFPELRRAARQSVFDNFDLESKCLPLQLKFLDIKNRG